MFSGRVSLAPLPLQSSIGVGALSGPPAPIAPRPLAEPRPVVVGARQIGGDLTTSLEPCAVRGFVAFIGYYVYTARYVQAFLVDEQAAGISTRFVELVVATTSGFYAHWRL